MNKGLVKRRVQHAQYFTRPGFVFGRQILFAGYADLTVKTGVLDCQKACFLKNRIKAWNRREVQVSGGGRLCHLSLDLNHSDIIRNMRTRRQLVARVIEF